MFCNSRRHYAENEGVSKTQNCFLHIKDMANMMHNVLTCGSGI